MPGQTPIYGFTYPCPDETVNASSFATLANQIDTKLSDVNNDLSAALLRRNASPFTTGTQVIPAGVDTVLTMVGLTYVIPAAGVWIARAGVFSQVGAPTVNMMRTRVRQNGVQRFGFTHNTEGNVELPPIAFGPVIAAAGDTISVTFLYDGTGTMTVSADLDLKMIVRIA
jgi:hypothetical protein